MPSSKKKRGKQNRLKKEEVKKLECRREEILFYLTYGLNDDIMNGKIDEYVTYDDYLFGQLRSASSLQSFHDEFIDSIDDRLTSYFVTLTESKAFHDKIRSLVPDSSVSETREVLTSFIDYIPTMLDEENKDGLEMFERHRREGIGSHIIDGSCDCGTERFRPASGMDRVLSYNLFYHALDWLTELAYKFIDDGTQAEGVDCRTNHYMMATDILTERFNMLHTYEGMTLLVKLVSGRLAKTLEASSISDGKLERNRTLSYFFVGVMIGLESKFDFEYSPYVFHQRMRDLHCDEDWNVVEFTSQRIPCNCLQVVMDKLGALRKESTCFECGTSIEFEDCKVCTGCYYGHYCSRECHRKHWPSHKADCRRLGGYMVEFREENGIAKGSHDELRKAWKEKTGLDF